VEIQQHLAAESAAVLCDPTQIHQVVVNLCSNAKHSMAETGGTLTVRLQEVDIAADRSDAPAELEPGLYIRLEIADTGEGMDKKTLQRIFDPYFTTKEKGIGTGLGLAVVRGIIKKYGGSIHVTSQPGKGTVFTVFLPRLSEPEPTADAVADPLPSGTEKLLIVDDEEALVELDGEMLRTLGYAVECHTNPIQALETFRRHPDRFDLVITDMTMPQMTGVELARNLLDIRPNIPIVLCTGFNEGLSDEQAQKIGIKVLEMKPLEMRDLAQTVRRVLDDSRSSSPIQ
jgi:CheY-like chemotaxis protein